MTWICLVFVPLITACRMSRFTKEENVALENHLIKIVTADHPIKCREDCLDTPSCFSVNVHAQRLSSGWVTCDLNNSSKTADPQDLVPKKGYQYLPMAEFYYRLLGEDSEPCQCYITSFLRLDKPAEISNRSV
ncbi:hypothetical protein ABFA07_022314 [Porites harrisoni]